MTQRSIDASLWDKVSCLAWLLQVPGVSGEFIKNVAIGFFGKAGSDETQH